MVLYAVLLLQAAPDADEAARAALRKLSERFADLKTLSCTVKQTRRTALLDKPVTSSGRMYYRSDPARLVFHMEEPRKTVIHLDKASYQVFRPDEKRLERLDFEGDEAAARLLMVFRPKTEEVAKAFTVRAGEPREGEVEIRLDPSDEKVKKHLTRLTLAVTAADATLKRIAYVDGEGDEVRFDLDKVAINAEVPAATFDLAVPEGTKVLRHSARAGR